MPLKPVTPVRTLARRNQGAGDVVCAACSWWLSSVPEVWPWAPPLLLVFVQSCAKPVPSLVLAVAATPAVLVTIGPMLGVEDSFSGPTREKIPGEQWRRALRPSSNRSARRRGRSPEALVPR
ncbi:MAG: hypothetical protein ACRDNK_07645 [Solirubrobacteraceae bacterium]